jgi:transcriptional regulator with XRE-family HTH domain/KaiC/GvpD/RAD55 family RecA-like ATPase
MTEKLRVASGVGYLDHLLGGLYIGDNVVWHDDAGSLASVFCLSFIQASQAQNKPLIYVSFDRSPKNLLDMLGSLAQNQTLTILDCFTYGKGEGSDVFLKFYEQRDSAEPSHVIKIQEPRNMGEVMDTLYGIHGTMQGDVRFVFESLTGMQELWGGEDQLIKFYTHSCPRLYELNTIAYWILEKRAHSSRLRAQINQIAQVAVDLSVKRGTTSLTILKAEKRNLDTLNKPVNYWSKDLNITFEGERRTTGRIDVGLRLKELRTKRGISQTDLAKQVGVTSSTISQVESNVIYPSLPALLKMAEVLSVEISSFFQETAEIRNRVVFRPAEATEIKFPDLPEGSIDAKLLTPLDFETKAEPYLIEIPPNRNVPSHFFIHKGEEVGYLLAGKLQLKVGKAVYTVQTGDVIYFTSEMPTQWMNPGPGPARLLWIKVR